MAEEHTKLKLSPGVIQDIWVEPEVDGPLLTAEIRAGSGQDNKHLALLFHELGRLEMAAGNHREAAQAFLESYTQRPRFRPTLRLARRMYSERGDHHLVLKLLQAEARATRDPLARAPLLRMQARTLWSRMQQRQAAVDVLETAFRIDPTDLATLKLLELYHACRRDDEGLRLALQRELDAVTDTTVRVALLTTLAQLPAGQSSGQAGQLMQQAAELNAAHAAKTGTADPVVAAGQQLVLTHHRRHRELAQLLLQQADDPRGSADWRARQSARAARIQLRQLGDADAAVDALHVSLALAPQFEVAADAFELHLQRGEWAEAVTMGQQMVALDPDPTFGASLAYQLAELVRTRLEDDEQAVAWYEQCLSSCPAYLPALESLGWLLEQRGEHERLLRVHRRELDAARSVHARAHRLYRIAVLLEQAQREGEATDVHQEALATRSDFSPSRSALERLYARQERWAELLQLYDQELELGPDPERAHYILATMAYIWEEKLDNLDQAVECQRRVLELVPGDLATLRVLGRLYRHARRWRDLVALYEEERRLIRDPRRQTEVLQRTGEVWEDQLFNLDEAMGCYRRALELDPRYLPALRALGRLLRQKGQWDALIQMHRSEISASTSPDRVVALLYDVAESYKEQLLDDEKAAESYAEILHHRRQSWPAREALEQILSRRKEWRALARLLEQGLAVDQHDTSRALRLWRMGLLKETHLDDAEGAINDYSRALRIGPQLVPVRAALQRLLETKGDHARLADILERTLDELQDDGLRATVSLRLGALWEQRLGHPAKATQHYAEAARISTEPWALHQAAAAQERLGHRETQLELLDQLSQQVEGAGARGRLQLQVGRLRLQTGTGDPVPHLEQALELDVGRQHAMDGLEQAYRQRADFPRLARLLRQRLDEATDPMARACLWTELAELCLRQQDSAEAEASYREALAHAPGHLTAGAGLAALLSRQQRWQELALLLEGQAGALESSGVVANLLMRAAVVWQDRVKDSARAIPLLRRVVELAPGSRDAYDRLHRIYSRREDWHELAVLIGSTVANVTDAAAAAEMYTELGQLHLQQLGQQRQGEACLRRALQVEPNHLQALRALSTLYGEMQDWGSAQDVLARLEPLITDADERADVSRRLGQAYVATGDHAQALQAFVNAVAVTGGRDLQLMHQLLAAARNAGNTKAHVAALQRLGEVAPDAAERIAARKELARLAVDTLGDDDLAVRVLNEVLVLDPLDLEAVEQLAAVHGRAGNRSAATQHLRAAVAHHRAAVARTPHVARLYQQLGRIFQWQRRFDGLYCSCAAVQLLDSLDETQQRFVASHGRRCNMTPTVTLPQQRYQELLLPEPVVAGPIRELLAAGGSGLQKRAAIAPSAVGIDRQRRLPKTSPLRTECRRIAAMLGGMHVDICVSSSQPELVTAEMFTRPSLVLGAAVAQGPIGPAERFRIGRALFLIAENALVLRDRSVRQINHLLAGLALAALPPLELPLTIRDPVEVEQETRALTRLLARKERKQIGALLPHLPRQPGAFRVAEFARALGQGANRAGLLAAGEPATALREAAQLAPHGTESPEMADLLPYLVGENYLTLRLELGIAPEKG